MCGDATLTQFINEIKGSPQTVSFDKSICHITGNTNLLTQQKVAILLSRQGKSVFPESDWFCLAKEILPPLQHLGLVPLVTSLPLYHDVLRHLARRNGPVIELLWGRGPLYKRVVEGNDDSSSMCRIFLHSKELKNQRDFFIARDNILSASADALVVMKIRAGGNMEKLTHKALDQNKPVLFLGHSEEETPLSLRHRMKHAMMLSPRKKIHHGQEKENASSLSIIQTDDRPLEQYLWHYTRAWPGPWPKQTWEEYIDSLVHEVPGAAHKSVHSLARIIEKGILYASHTVTRGKIPVLCFTELPPTQIESVRFYNNALNRWTFSHYGIGFSKETMCQRGAKPVIYGTEKTYQTISTQHKYLYQKERSSQNKWSWKPEREWRLKGNLDLSTFAKEDIIIVVKKKDNLQEISWKVPYSTILIE